MWGVDGAAYELIWALVIFDYRDWAKDYVYRAWHNDPTVFSPYRALGVLGLMANTEGGGPQAGNHGQAGDGYEGDYAHGATYALLAWQTKTGQSLFDKTNYFKKYPELICKLYLGNFGYSDHIAQTLEYITGILPDTDEAARARWLVNNVRRAKYADAFRFAIGRLEGPELPPDDLPLQGYVDGAGMVYSRTGFSDSDTQIYVTARERDLFRNENDPGCIGIKHRGEWVNPIGSAMGKSGITFISATSPWILADNQVYDVWPIAYDNPNTPEDEADRHTTIQMLCTYWTGKRAKRVEQVIENPEDYVKNSIRSQELDNGVYRFVLDTGDQHDLGNWRQVYEIDGNTIRIYTDITPIDDAVSAGLGIRFNRVPEMSEPGVFSLDGVSWRVNGPAFTAEWVDELVGPMGYWRGSRKGGYTDGYSDNQARNDHMGAGSVWIKPKEKAPSYQFEQIIELS